MAEVRGVGGSSVVVQRRLKDTQNAEANRKTQDDAANSDAVQAERKQNAESDNSVRVQRQQDEQATQNQQEKVVDLTTPPPVSPALKAAERASESQQQVERARNIKAEQNQPVAEKEIGGTINVTT